MSPTWLDRALAALLATWALGSLLPVGAWVGTVPPDSYADAWALWWRTGLLVALGTALVVLLSRGAAARWLRTLLGALARMPRAPFLAALGVLAALEAVGVAVWCFARNPQSLDAWVQYFQARIFLSGRLVAPVPPSIAHFATLHAAMGERGWFTHFPPVQPALLALGLAAGAPWLVTPLAAAFLPAAVHRLGARTADERVARVAAGLVLLSPFAIAIDASAMNHLPAALCVALGLAAMPAVAAGSAAEAAVLGGATGLLLGLRPLDATVLAALGAVAVATAVARGRWAVAPALGALGVAAAAPTLVYNAATTGSPLTFTYSALWGPGLNLGLGHAVPWGEALSLGRAVGNTTLDAHQLNLYLLEWPLPVTLLAAAALWRRRGSDWLALDAAYLLGLVGALFFYFHRDTLYGPRFLFSVVPPLLVLVAATLVRLATLERPLGWRGLALGDLALVGLAVVALVAAGDLAPRRLASYAVGGTTLAVHPEADAARAGIHRAVVLIPDGWGTRLITRLWAAGVPMRESDRFYFAFDACRLEELLAAAEAGGVRGEALTEQLTDAMTIATPGRPMPGLTRDPRLRLPADGRVTQRCADEIQRDQRGTLQFTQHLYLNAPTLDGDVVWARELGPADAALRAAFPGRAFYRYAPGPDGTPTFTPLP